MHNASFTLQTITLKHIYIEVLQPTSSKFQRAATPRYLATHRSTAEQATQMVALFYPVLGGLYGRFPCLNP